MISKVVNMFGENIEVFLDGKIVWNNEERPHYLNRDGYPVVSIKTNKGWRSIGVHRFIAEAFIPKPNNVDKFEVNHKDYNRENYNVENLEWMTHEENVVYSKCNRPDYNGENNPNYGNTKLSDIYKNNPDYAKEKQSRPGLRNGRCTKIRLYDNGILIKEFDYIKLCCQYLIDNGFAITTNPDSVRVQIQKCINNKKAYKSRFTFERC